MGRHKAWLPINPDDVVVEYVKLGRDDGAVANLKVRFDKAPYAQRQILRARLEQAVELFAEARARNDRLLQRR